MIMRDSSAAICHRYEKGGWGGAERQREKGREMEGGREGGKCRPSVQQPCHKPTITQASGLQFNIKTCFAPVCEGELWVQLKKQKKGHKTCALSIV